MKENARKTIDDSYPANQVDHSAWGEPNLNKSEAGPVATPAEEQECLHQVAILALDRSAKLLLAIAPLRADPSEVGGHQGEFRKTFALIVIQRLPSRYQSRVLGQCGSMT